MTLIRWAGIGAAAFAFLLLAIQFVPYGRAHTNPPVTAEPAWDRPETRELARRACFDCHSNETAWPWYTSLAPTSWLAQRHVNEGRRELNFSEWDGPQRAAREAVESVRDGEMPTRDYLLVHPEARLTPAERQALIQGLGASLGAQSERRGEGDRRESGR
jgi:mono/diheme cytochrome c family protein